MTLFRFQPNKSTIVAFATGLSIILLSTAMILFKGSQIETIMHILLRDFLMIFIVGFCFPLLYVRAKEKYPYATLGITKHRLKTSLALNVFFAILLLLSFILGNGQVIIISYKSLFQCFLSYRISVNSDIECPDLKKSYESLQTLFLLWKIHKVKYEKRGITMNR